MESIQSQYNSWCFVCKKKIFIDDLIVFDEDACDDRKPDGRWVHEECEGGCN